MDSAVDVLIHALRRLDLLLQNTLAAACNSVDSGEAPALRGLYIAPEEVVRLLRRDPGSPTHVIAQVDCGSVILCAEEFPLLAKIAQAFTLSQFDLDVLAITLAPELDLRYERIYAYLQDDITRRRPSLDLVLNLLCKTAEEKITRRANFAPDSPLIKNGIIRLLADPNQPQQPLLAHNLKLDDQIVRWLVGDRGQDRRLDGCCTTRKGESQANRAWEMLPIPVETSLALRSLLRRSRATKTSLRLYLQGPHGTGKLRAAHLLASEAGGDLIVADLKRLPESLTDFEATLAVLFREAWWTNAVLYFDQFDTMRREDRAAQFSALMQQVATHAGVVILSGESDWISNDRIPSDIVRVRFDLPDFGMRRQYWQSTLGTRGPEIDSAAIEMIADRFRLTPAQIDDAICAARNRALWRCSLKGSDPELSPSITLDDLFAAARAQCGHELAKLAKKVSPKQSWSEIVLPSDQLEQLREICEQSRFRHVVYEEWGFDRKLSLGKGLNVLFAGPPGTGKTMAAEVIARELQVDLYKIDLSQVVSKYIGETEKNLDRIFTAAENANAILFFDEADALFGKRSEVKDSHDRYANIEIGYLLQKMEEYGGVAILSTNLRQNLDDAFVRRMHFVVDFPFPDEEHRRRIWQVMFPEEAPLDSEVDFTALAREIKLAGGNIKNIALSAAFYAAADGRVINVDHLARAARREHQKLGRMWSESSLIRQSKAALEGDRSR